MKALLALLALLALTFTWGAQRLTSTRLESEADTLRAQSHEAIALQRERERLLRSQPTPEELVRLCEAAEERSRLQAELAAREQTAPHPPSPAFDSGEWTSMQTWKNCGQSAPAAAIETMLWAASGGDVAGLQNVLLLDEATRKNAGALLNRRPALSRAFQNPEQLVAAFTAKAIPLGDAQLLWQQQSGPDDATLGVILRNREAAAETVRPSAIKSDSEKVPPSLPADAKTKLRILTLRRRGDGWRLVVPPSAIENIAREIAAPVR